MSLAQSNKNPLDQEFLTGMLTINLHELPLYINKGFVAENFYIKAAIWYIKDYAERRDC